MKIKISLIIVSFILLPMVVAFNINEYQYVSTLNVNCEEYKGYVRVELPSEYNALLNPKSYMDVDSSVFKIKDIDFYNKLNNWFVKSIEGYRVSEVEKLYDNNYNNYLLSQGENIEFEFENPEIKSVNKIVLDLRDSSITGVTIMNHNGQIIPYTQVVDNFHYEYFLTEPLTTDKFRINVRYNELIKIKEVSIYELKSFEEKAFLYFYVNNNCSDTFRFYFGEYGKSNSKYGQQHLPVEFSVDIETMSNIEYDNDFDDDNVLNLNDNCLTTSNEDQKDINYNNVGDACEDDDNDRVMNSVDNCVNRYNRDQVDSDGDGIGNACDDKDDRFLESNKYLIFIAAGVVALLFVALAIILIKKH